MPDTEEVCWPAAEGLEEEDGTIPPGSDAVDDDWLMPADESSAVFTAGGLPDGDVLVMLWLELAVFTKATTAEDVFMAFRMDNLGDRAPPF